MPTDRTQRRNRLDTTLTFGLAVIGTFEVVTAFVSAIGLDDHAAATWHLLLGVLAFWLADRRLDA